MNENDRRSTTRSQPCRALLGRALAYRIWAGVMPVAVTYAHSGLVAALAAACNLALTKDR